MNHSTAKQIIFPLLTALFFGTSYVVQSVSTNYLGCFTFNWTRCLLAAATLFSWSRITQKLTCEVTYKENTVASERRNLLCGGLIVGTLLMAAVNLQQQGLKWTSAGKAGFITTLYIVIVPLIGLFLHKHIRPLVWCGISIAVLGLFFLSFDISGALALNRGDLNIFICAFIYSAHILFIDYYTKAKKVNGIKLSCAQFTVAAAESFLLALVFEKFSVEQILSCLPYILYAGVVSGGIGYTLQILAQAEGDPTIVSLLLSLESVFSVAGGAMFLHERMSTRVYIGCVLMMCSVILVQLPEGRKHRIQSRNGESLPPDYMQTCGKHQ